MSTDHHAPHDQVLWQGPSRREAEELVLALASVGIDYRFDRDGERNVVRVRSPDLLRAREEVRALEKDRADDRALLLDPADDRREAHRSTGRGLVGAIGYAFLLLANATLQKISTLDGWARGGVLEPEAIRRGEIWRGLTALGLHADAFHFLGNVLLGALFVFFLAEEIGVGLALFLAFFSGALGNVLGTFFRHLDQSVIGASNAVFAALGLLAGSAITKKTGAVGLIAQFKRWRPFVAALALLGLYGGISTSAAFPGAGLPDDEGGPTNIDVYGHFCGFLAGCLVGVIFARRRAWRDRGGIQWVFFAGLILLWPTAWWLVYLKNFGGEK